MAHRWRPSSTLTWNRLRMSYRLGAVRHDARCKRRSLARSTLLGIRASMSTAVMVCSLHSGSVVRRAGAGTEAAQGAFGADGVGTLEDPVLPGRETGEDLGLHRLGPGEAV